MIVLESLVVLAAIACGTAVMVRRSLRHLLLAEAALWMAGAAFAGRDHETVSCWDQAALAAVALGQWWFFGGGGDDFHRGRREAARKVAEVAGRLRVVPAPAGAR